MGEILQQACEEISIQFKGFIHTNVEWKMESTRIANIEFSVTTKELTQDVFGKIWTRILSVALTFSKNLTDWFQPLRVGYTFNKSHEEVLFTITLNRR